MHRVPDDDGLSEAAGAVHPLILLLRRPEAAVTLDAQAWTRVLFAARKAALLGRVAAGIGAAGVLDALPDKVRSYLNGAMIAAESNQRALRWEVRCLERLLGDVGDPLVLLKGMAYVAANLPVARGRRASDVDILVARHDLARVEATLLGNGWAWVKTDPYDQHYYRDWMHELPPLRHVARGVVTDVHHAILPLTGRIRPDSDVLLQRARPVPGMRWSVLAPADMVIHSVVHLFQDGDLTNGLRDLVDIDGLLRHYGTDPVFWSDLETQVSRLGVGRPWFYAMCYARRRLLTPIPETVCRTTRLAAPSWPLRWLMDRLIMAALAPREPDGGRPGIAAFALYVRSHWLRMPPLMLARHLLRKARRGEPR
ncbi:MAG: nucleotidyltransferase family protein [Alphaproteobacteria bacterium]